MNFEKYYDEFINKIDPLSDTFIIRPRGIWTSELFALYAFSQEFKIDHYIESGLGNGQSFINMFSLLDTKVWKTGIDLEEKDWTIGFAPSYLNSMFLCGVDGIKSIDREIRFLTNQSIGVFLDGPKGLAAYELAIDCMLYNSNVSFVALHDTPKGSDVRERIEDCEKWNTWSSDDIDFVKRFMHLDNCRWMEHLPEDKKSGHLPYLDVRTGKYCPSYGPTLSVIYKD